MNNNMLQGALALPAGERCELARRTRDTLVAGEPSGEPGECPRRGCLHVVRGGTMPTAPSVGSDMGAGARPARGWVAAGAIEAVPSGARVRRCHALARGHFPRGAKGGCSVSLPTSWCMGRQLCDVMA